MVSIVKDGEFGIYMSEKREIYGMKKSMQVEESGKGKLMWNGKAMSSFCSIRLHMVWLDGKASSAVPHLWCDYLDDDWSKH